MIDNGAGIKPTDWPSIGLKHHTSKLPSFDALSSIATFGFRGEALSSLCALSEHVSVTTATREMGGLASRLCFDREGNLVPGAPEQVARQRGTTVRIEGLFKPLPVRRKECERNAKREFAKAMAVMTAYALVPCCAGAGGVRLVVDSVTAAGCERDRSEHNGEADTALAHAAKKSTICARTASPCSGRPCRPCGARGRSRTCWTLNCRSRSGAPHRAWIGRLDRSSDLGTAF